MNTFKITQSKGFQMTFKNGLTISVQFGHGNYCTPVKITDFDAESETAEVAIWDESDNWFDFGGDAVKGWMNTEDVAQLIAAVQLAENLYSIILPLNLIQ